MALMKSAPPGFFEQMSRAGFADAREFTGGYAHYSQFDGTGSATPGQERKSAGTRVCLDCALPLRADGESQPGACRCRQQEEIEEDLPAFSRVEIAVILCLVTACVAASFRFWL